MALIFTSEYVGNTNRKIAQVFKNENGRGFTVRCYISMQEQRQEIFNTETQADNFAEDWVQDTTSE